MSKRLLASAVVLLLACAALTPTAPVPTEPPPPGAADLIPQDAVIGIAVRNLKDLKKKGDKLVADGGIDDNLRPSKLFDLLYDMLPVKGALDENAGASIFIANPALLGVQLFKETGGINEEAFKLLVLVLPFQDVDKIAAALELKKGELRPGKIVAGRGLVPPGGYFTVRDKHLIWGHDEKVVAAVVKAKPTGSVLPAERRKALNGTDGVLHLDPKALGPVWDVVLKELERELVGATGGSDPKAVQLLLDSLNDVRYVLATLSVDNGIGVSLVTVFPEKKNDATKQLLAAFKGTGSSDLNGLPEGRVVAAEGMKADGALTLPVMKVLFNLFFREFARTRLLVADSQRAHFAGVFAEVWQRLKGSRFAVYHNADEAKQGLFSAVAILDTEDPEKFLHELRQLARLVDAADFDLGGKNPRKDDVAEVEKLIRELGSDKYEVRESASTKLGLIGEPALPYLEKALTSDDAEIRRRAKALKGSIEESAALRKKELLVREPVPVVRPTFGFLPKETLDGQKVDVVGIKLADKEFAAVKQYEKLFGPDWNKLRLAVHGKQVVVLLGSDQELLKAALKNLKDGGKGLGAAKQLTAFGAHADPGRTVEAHVSLQTFLAATEDDWKELTKAGASRPVSSVAITVDPDRLQLDLWIPVKELKVLTKTAAAP